MERQHFIDEILQLKHFTLSQFNDYLGLRHFDGIQSYIKDNDLGCKFKLVQYLGGFHPDVLMRMKHLLLTFPYLHPKWNSMDLDEQCKIWILQHTFPLPFICEPLDFLTQDSWGTIPSVIVCHGSLPLTQHSPLVRSMLSNKQSLFFTNQLMISSTRMREAMEWMVAHHYLVVVSEYQDGPIASIVKQMQDCRSSPECCILLYGTNAAKCKDVASKVLYSVSGVHKIREPICDELIK